jgi:hypothetical protein
MKPVFFDNVLAGLEAAHATGHNVLLYGPPGHNKTAGAEYFLTQMKKVGRDKIFMKSISSGTTIEDMYGGIDIKKMRTAGQIEYRLTSEEFFGNYEYAIFDEILDAKEKVLASLKDTLMAREVRNGAQRHPLKTKMIIGLTNVDAEDFSSNWERAAILERFPIRILVKWDDYSPSAFSSLMQAVCSSQEFAKLGDFGTRLAEFAALSYSGDTPVSPRTVVQAAKAVAATGKPEYGWLIAGNNTQGPIDIPAEIALKWRMGRIDVDLSNLLKAEEFSRVQTKLAFLREYVGSRASTEERNFLTPLIDKFSKLLHEHLMV